MYLVRRHRAKIVHQYDFERINGSPDYHGGNLLVPHSRDAGEHRVQGVTNCRDYRKMHRQLQQKLQTVSPVNLLRYSRELQMQLPARRKINRMIVTEATLN